MFRAILSRVIQLLLILFLPVEQAVNAAIIKPKIPQKILNMPASKPIKMPGIDRPVYLDEPIYAGSNFTWSEATKGGSRIPVDTWFNGELVTAAEITQNIIDFAYILDGIRAEFGNRPIYLNSWYRPPAVNKAAGGKDKSFHLIGLAGDARIRGLSAPLVYARLSQTWEGGLGNDGEYTHIDARYLLGWDSARWKY